MSTFLDDIFGPLTLDMVGLFGKSVTHSRVTPGTYNTATGTATPTTATQTLPAIIEEYKGAELVSGLVMSGDKKVSIAGAAFATPPKPTDTITIDGLAFTVVEVAAIYSGEDVALYVLKCRKA